MAKERFEPTTYWLGNKKIRASARVQAQDLQPHRATIIEVPKCINGLDIKWSFGGISEKKRITDHDFPPPFMWAENNKREYALKESVSSGIVLDWREHQIAIRVLL